VLEGISVRITLLTREMPFELGALLPTRSSLMTAAIRMSDQSISLSGHSTGAACHRPGTTVPRPVVSGDIERREPSARRHRPHVFVAAER
jgi:hypothetical protein